MLEILAGLLGVGVLVLAYMALAARDDANKAQDRARAHAADSVVNRARAAKYRKVLETWGEDVQELDRKIEVAHGGKVGPAIDSFRATVRSLRKDKDGGGSGPAGGEGGGVPPA